MLSLLVLAIACLPQFISSSNLALTFDAANNTCTAACTTCSDTSNTDTNQYNTDDGVLDELLKGPLQCILGYLFYGLNMIA